MYSRLIIIHPLAMGVRGRHPYLDVNRPRSFQTEDLSLPKPYEIAAHEEGDYSSQIAAEVFIPSLELLKGV